MRILKAIKVFAKVLCLSALLSSWALKSFGDDVFNRQWSSCDMTKQNDRVAEEDTACIAHIAAMIVTQSLTFGVGGVVYFLGLVGSAASIKMQIEKCKVPTNDALRAKLADPSSTPTAQSDGSSPYSFAQIEWLLEKQLGRKPTIAEITDKYEKICLSPVGGSDSDQKWLAKEQCEWMRAGKVCAFNPDGMEQLTCARVSSTCPCLGNIQEGHLDPPDYEKDADGNLKFEDGRLVVKDQAFESRRLMHCKFAKVPRPIIEPPPEVDTSIIDTSCRNYRGVSKVETPFTSFIVQCIEGTARNIFEKQISGSLSAEMASRINLTTEEAEKIGVLMDIQRVLPMPLYSSTILRSYAFMGNVRTWSQNTYPTSQTDFNKLLFDTYKLIKPTSSVTQQTLSTNEDVIGIDDVQAAISRIQTTALGRVRASNTTTFFQIFQQKMVSAVLIAMVLHIAILGASTLLGSGLMGGPREYMMFFMKFALVYYFAIGTAWRDVFFNGLFAISNTIAKIVVDAGATNNSSSTKNDKCNYSGETFKFRLNNNNSIDVRRGPFIERPNYFRPRTYNYETFEVSDNNDGRAAINKGSDGLESISPIISATQSRTAGSPNVGENVAFTYGHFRRIFRSNVTVKDANSSAVTSVATRGIPTSLTDSMEAPTSLFYRITETGGGHTWEAKTEVVRSNLNPMTEIEIAEALAIVNQLESVRNAINKEERDYPSLPIAYDENGNPTRFRDMGHISIFDTLDCKLSKYFMVTGNFPGIAAVALRGLWLPGIGILIFTFCVMFIVGTIIVMMRVVQMYLISVIALTIFVYVSPVIIPCCLFKTTEKIFSNWLDKIRGFVFYPAVLFTVTAILIRVMDMMYYGDPSRYDNLFDNNGNISGTCYDGNINNAPLACTLKRAFLAQGTANLLFIALPVLSLSADWLGRMLLELVKGVVIIYITMYLLENVEEIIQKLVSGAGLDQTNTIPKAGDVTAKAGGAAASKVGGKTVDAIKGAARQGVESAKGAKDAKDDAKSGSQLKSRAGGGGGGGSIPGAGGGGGMPGGGSIPGGGGGGAGP